MNTIFYALGPAALWGIFPSASFLHGTACRLRPIADAVRVLIWWAMRVTYLGRETITVPAGTFETCHMRSASVEGVAPFDNWVIAAGPYRGLLVKQMGEDGTGTVTTALSASFK